MTQPPIRAVVFDAVGTLIHPDPAFAVVYAEVGRRFGSRIDMANMQLAFRAAFLRQEELDRAAGWKTSESREIERWRTIVGHVLHDVTDPEACFTALYEHFSQPRHWRCAAGIAALFTALEDRGFRVAVASNFDHRLRQVAAGLPALAALADLVISSEIGWRKPANEFFASVCGTLKVKPEEVLYVGDDLANDFEGATAAGCRALHFDPTGRMRGRDNTVCEANAVLDWLSNNSSRGC